MQLRAPTREARLKVSMWCTEVWTTSDALHQKHCAIFSSNRRKYPVCISTLTSLQFWGSPGWNLIQVMTSAQDSERSDDRLLFEVTLFFLFFLHFRVFIGWLKSQNFNQNINRSLWLSGCFTVTTETLSTAAWELITPLLHCTMKQSFNP